jgi:hypothetical protein
MVFDQNGKLSRRFTVKLEAHWNKNKGTINEWFTFNDGEKSTRTWQYDLLIEVDSTEYQVTLDDWMYLLNDKRLFNKTDIIKYGLKSR